MTYADFKETILKRHKELLHPGIEKTTKWFWEKYYFPDYQKLIQNIINKCESCNIAKTEHRNTKLRIIGSETDRYTTFEIILYIRITIHNASNQIGTDIFMYARTPDYDALQKKE